MVEYQVVEELFQTKEEEGRNQVILAVEVV